jgi:hypothetical protein
MKGVNVGRARRWGIAIPRRRPGNSHTAGIHDDAVGRQVIIAQPAIGNVERDGLAVKTGREHVPMRRCTIKSWSVLIQHRPGGRRAGQGECKFESGPAGTTTRREVHRAMGETQPNIRNR